MGGRGMRLCGALAGLLGGCAFFAAPGPPPPSSVPLITRFEVFPNAQRPGEGPFELLAHASGEGLLGFRWEATGGWLSVASASASGSGLLPAFSAWQPPAVRGRYEVTLSVTDGQGTTSRRRAVFAVEERFTRILEPRPAQIGLLRSALPPAAPFPAHGLRGHVNNRIDDTYLHKLE